MGSEPARTTPAERQRSALLALARALAQTRDGAVLSDSLEVVLGGLGGRHGLVYRVVDRGLDLVADRGASPELRHALARVEPEPAWSVLQAAVSARRPVVERAFASSVADRLGVDAAALDGWSVAVAVPVVAGRRALAVVLVGAETESAFDAPALTYLETACHVIAVALAREQTATKRESDRLLRDAQITALGILAASVVEDLRAPLAAIAIGLKEQDRLVAELKAAEAGRVEVAQLTELTTEAHAAVRRARDVTARLVAAVEQTPYVPIDVANVARDALDVVRQAFEERTVALEASVDKGCAVRGRPDELTHLVAAMLDNALDAADRATGAGGARRVRLTVRDETVRVVVAVEDSGAGVPADLRGKIFDPFFSTKTGRIGIGLTMCRQTVLAHKGHLELSRSIDLGGACFRVVLPSAQHDGQASRDRQLTTPPLGLPALGRPRVVWIDDEEVFLSSMRRGLPEWDLRTGKTAADGERLVLELAPMVVFCDLGLPDRGGHELHAAIAVKDPELARRFVFVTGGVITPEIADYLIASGCLTLLKPVRLEEIRALVDGRVADAAPLSARTLREQPSVPPPHKRRTAPPDGG